MKKTIVTLIVLALAAAPFLSAQNQADEDYIKAMTESDPCKKVQGLKDFIAKHGGKGSQYENFAYAHLCLTPCPTKPPKESIEYGEKALTFKGLDDLTRVQILLTLSGLYSELGQSLDKAQAHAGAAIAIGRANKDKEPSGAAQWTSIMGAGHFAQGQAMEKAKDYKGAVDAYVMAYGLLKNPQILAALKKTAKILYDGKNYADAEKAFRAAYSISKDHEAGTMLALTLLRAGKQDEALPLFKESYAKKRTGELAYNIGIILARKAKTDSRQADEAVRYLLEASFLYPSQSKQAMSLAESLFFTANQELRYNENIKEMQEKVAYLNEITADYNKRFGDKSDEDLTAADKKAIQTLTENIEAQKAAIQKLEAAQKAAVDKFNALIADTKKRLGVK